MKVFEKNKTRIVILFLLVICFPAFSQKVFTDSVHQLLPVSVTAERLNACSIGYKIDTIDSLTLAETRTLTATELLSQYTSVYIKSYGLDNIASVMFRGTAAGHTGIFWNGISVNTPNLGSYDLSLIPASFFNAVEIKHGGAAALYGSGNIGGSIFFGNEPVFKKQISTSINQSLGSFGTYVTNGTFNIADKNVFSKTCFYRKDALNNFPYTDYTQLSLPRERMKNDHVIQYGLINDTYLHLSKSQMLGISLWYENSDRNIPATLLSGVSKAYQTDQAERAMLSWKINVPAVSFQIKAAYLNNYYNYDDSIVKINSTYKTHTYITETEADKIIGNNRFHIGLTGKADNADITTYASQKKEYTGAAYLSYIRHFPKIGFSVNINLRQEFVEEYSAPFSPSIGLEDKMFKNLTFSGSVSKNFRTPTFNERYYQPGGNLQLKPETSWNEEAGLTYRLKKNDAFHVDLSATVYNSMIDDFIIWVPISSNTSQAQNVLKVHCRGIESSAKASITKGDFVFTLNASYTYARSSYEKEIIPGDNSLHKQLIYVPSNDVCGTLRVTYRKKFYVSYNQTYTGKRFIAEDNTSFLPDYTIGNINTGALINVSKLKSNIEFSVRNIWSERYYPIEWMPMPEINYMVTVGIGI
jgi:vitamin B12 transporter